MNEHACTVHNIRSHKIQTQLNMIHPQIFPELKAYRAKVTPPAVSGSSQSRQRVEARKATVLSLKPNWTLQH